MKKISLLIFLAMSSSCGFAPEPLYSREEVPSKNQRPEPASPEQVQALERFSMIQAQVIEPHCLKCHNPQNAKGEVDLSSLQSTLRKPKVVEFGEPDESLFYVTILEGSMPEKAEPLDMELTDLVRRWIAGEEI